MITQTLSRYGATLTVQDLLDFLQDCHPESEVKITFQPTYPLMAQVSGALEVDPDGVDLEGEDIDQRIAPEGEGQPGTVYLFAGHADEYLASGVATAATDEGIW